MRRLSFSTSSHNSSSSSTLSSRSSCRCRRRVASAKRTKDSVRANIACRCFFLFSRLFCDSFLSYNIVHTLTANRFALGNLTKRGLRNRMYEVQTISAKVSFEGEPFVKPPILGSAQLSALLERLRLSSASWRMRRMARRLARVP